MTPYATVELFHLLFLGQLNYRVAQNFFALKGGCNLRFYFKSVRYSEDIDIDVHTISVETLRKNIRQILKNKTLIDTLRSRDIEIASISEPKQTATTQRFKISLRGLTTGRESPTKIEFSRRKTNDVAVIEPIEPEIIAHYNLYPIHMFHYTRVAAITQKIGALIGRAQTQARDLFDLSLLTGVGIESINGTFSREEIDSACDHALSLHFDDFKGQVVAFLMPEYQSYYDSEVVWNKMVSGVIESLRGMSHEPA